jgi:hypothetical protein
MGRRRRCQRLRVQGNGVRKIEDGSRECKVKKDIKDIGINKCARESGFDRKNIIRKLLRNILVKRNSYERFELWLKSYKIGVK